MFLSVKKAPLQDGGTIKRANSSCLELRGCQKVGVLSGDTSSVCGVWAFLPVFCLQRPFVPGSEKVTALSYPCHGNLPSILSPGSSPSSKNQKRGTLYQPEASSSRREGESGGNEMPRSLREMGRKMWEAVLGDKENQEHPVRV